MVTEVDEGKGLVKTYWKDIRERVAKVEPKFAALVDELNPDKTFPVYLAYYPYGEYITDTETVFIPDENGNCYKLSDPDAPEDVIKHLGYGKDSAPFCMLLEKTMEWFIDKKIEQMSIPWTISLPGYFFPLSRILSKKSARVYTPNGVLSSTSGIRSTFTLPNIGCITNHINLQRDFNVQSPPPKSLYEHWDIFKQIVQSEASNCEWNCCLIYFAEKWLDKLQNDPAWLKLKMYLHEIAWNKSEYDRNRIYYDISFSFIQNKRHLKPNPYLADTARHLFAIAIGASAGYIPSYNNEALPLDILQKAFVESYGLKKYIPTIMRPTHFVFEQDEFPIYYSLQNPSSLVFSPKSRKISSTLFEMRELEHIMKIFRDELAKDNQICSDTIMHKIAKGTEFNYFHNEEDQHRIIKSSTEITEHDERFNYVDKQYKVEGAKFASDAKFVRGCVSIQIKKQDL